MPTNKANAATIRSTQVNELCVKLPVFKLKIPEGPRVPFRQASKPISELADRPVKRSISSGKCNSDATPMDKQNDFNNLLTEEAQTTTAQVALSKFPLTFEPKDKFMGMKVFDVDTDRYMKSRLGKKKYTRYSRYVGEDEVGETIRAYGRKYPKEGIILRDVTTSQMIFLRRPILDKV